MLSTVPQRTYRNGSEIIFLPRENSIYLLHHKNNIMEILQTTLAEITKVQVPSKTEKGNIITEDYERIEHFGEERRVEWRHAGSDKIVKEKELEALEVAFQKDIQAETLPTVPEFVQVIRHPNVLELVLSKKQKKRQEKVYKKLSKRQKAIYHMLFDFMD